MFTALVVLAVVVTVALVNGERVHRRQVARDEASRLRHREEMMRGR